MGAGERIKCLADTLGLNLHQFSLEAKVPYNTIYSLVKRDSKQINTDIVMKLSDVFGLPASFFLCMPPFDDLDSLSKYKAEVLDSLKQVCEEMHLKGFDPNDDIDYWRLVGLVCGEIHFSPDGKKIYVGLSQGASVRLDRREHLSAKESELLDYFLLLNQQGQGKVVDYAHDLLRNPDYQRSPIDLPERKK